MSKGQLRQSGISKKVTEAYLQDTLQQVYGESVSLETNSTEPTPPIEDALTTVDKTATYPKDGQQLFTNNINTANGWKSGVADITAVEIIKKEAGIVANPILGFLVRDKLGQDLFGENTLSASASKMTSVVAGQNFIAEFIFTLPMLPNGQYAVVASAADGDLYNNVQHHFLHDALIINVTSSKIRWGLVGIPFESISLQASNDIENT
jgi:lipopolysaccharide transport system ATP-binding protein